MSNTEPTGKIQVADLYDEVAPAYDQTFTSPEDRAEDVATFTLLAEAYRKVERCKGGLPPDVLDLGCGTGLVLEKLRETPPVIRYTGYTGLDVSPEMITRAQAKFPGFRFLIGDMDLLAHQFAPASFDLIVSTYGALSYCAHPRPAIAAMARLLRPGGRVLVQAFSRSYPARASQFALRARAHCFKAATLRRWFGTFFRDVRVTGINTLGVPALMLAETRTIGRMAPDLAKYLVVEGGHAWRSG